MDEGQAVVEGELAVRGMREEVPGDQLMAKSRLYIKGSFKGKVSRDIFHRVLTHPTLPSQPNDSVLGLFFRIFFEIILYVRSMHG